MGTFKIDALIAISQSGIGQYAVGGAPIIGVPSNAQVAIVANSDLPISLSYYFASGVPNPTGEVSLLADSRKIYLDGSATPTDEVDIPNGFLVSAATLKGWGGLVSDITATLKLKIGATLGTSLPPNFGDGEIPSLVYSPTAPATLTSLNSILAALYGIAWTNAGLVATPIVFNIYIEGTYVTLSWSVGVSNGLDAVDFRIFGAGSLFALWSGGALVGDIGNIYSTATPSKTGPDLKGTFGAGSGGGVDSIVFSWFDATLGEQFVTVDNSDFDEWTIIYISFLLPLTLPANTLIIVTIVWTNAPPIPPPFGTGTQFSGSVKLGTIKILTTAASGIYKIEADKTSDTIYINSPTNDDNVEVMIPYPHVKTSFIGG